MDPLFFIIRFTYDIKPTELQVDLCAAIEMIGDDHCTVRNIRRVDINESSLLPELRLKKVDGVWVHLDNGKESNIAAAVGAAVGNHLKELKKDGKELKKKQ